MEVVTKLSKDVHKDVGNAVERSTEVGKIIERGNKENALQETDITTNLKTTHEKTGQVVAAVEECKKINDENQKRIDWLHETVMQWQPKIEKFNEVDIANDFEYLLAKYMYPRGTKFGRNEVFQNLKQWLDVNKKIPNHEGNEKWKAWAKKNAWTDEHDDVLCRMLNLKSTKFDRARIEDIRRMAKQLRSMNAQAA